MYNKIPNVSKLTSFVPVRVPKVKDIFRRMGYRRTSQSVSGQVADFSRNPLESFDGENRRMSQHYYEKYVELMRKEESEKQNEKPSVNEEKPGDNQPLEEKEV